MVLIRAGLADPAKKHVRCSCQAALARLQPGACSTLRRVAERRYASLLRPSAERLRELRADTSGSARHWRPYHSGSELCRQQTRNSTRHDTTTLEFLLYLPHLLLRSLSDSGRVDYAGGNVTAARLPWLPGPQPAGAGASVLAPVASAPAHAGKHKPGRSDCLQTGSSCSERSH